MMKKIGIFVFAMFIGLATIMQITYKQVASQPVITPPIFIPSSGNQTAFAMPSGHTLHFMAATGCNDANSGTSAGSPWCTPNHALSCGDVIVAAPGSYTNAFDVWGTVSNCPSTTGGIDGAGGIFAAVLLCGGTDLSTSSTTTSCTVNCATAPTPCNGAGGVGAGMSVNKSNWAIEGWVITSSNNPKQMAYEAAGCTGGVTHHNYYINTVVYDTAIGYTPQDCGNITGVDTFGADYQRIVGMVAEHANQFGAGAGDAGLCTAAIVVVSPGVHGAVTDNHYFIYNSFAYNNANPACDTVAGQADGENFMWDTIDNHGPIGKYVMANNVGFIASRWCIHDFFGNGVTTALTIREYNNTCFNNSTRSTQGGILGEMDVQGDPAQHYTHQLFNNIMYDTNPTTPVGGTQVTGFNMGGVYFSTQIGGQYQNSTNNNNIILAAAVGPCFAAFCNQNTTPISASSFGTATGFGTNTYISPDFKNTTDLLANHLVKPPCAGFTNTTACMGWNAITQTMTSLSILDDLTPNATGNCSPCVGGGGVNPKGFQNPSTTCVSSGELFNDYPADLKGLVYLQYNSSSNTVFRTLGLATIPCGL